MLRDFTLMSLPLGKKAELYTTHARQAEEGDEKFNIVKIHIHIYIFNLFNYVLKCKANNG